jgi:hypothetical protein
MRSVKLVLAGFLASIGLLADTCTSPCIAVATSTGGASSSTNMTGATVLIATVSRFGSAIAAPSDSSSNSWTCLTNYNNSGQNANIGFCYVCGPTVTSSMTFTPASGTIVVIGYSGTRTSGCFDTGQDVGTTTNVATPATTITPSSASSGYLVVSAFGNDQTGETAGPTDNQGNTILQGGHLGGGAAEYGSQAYRNYSSTSAITITWTNLVAFGATASAGFLGPAAATNSLTPAHATVME